MTISTFEAAKEICVLSNWTITNLKLQKILYLTHRTFLGRNNIPLIDEQFEAWKYGPVLPTLYNHIKMFGNQPVYDRFYGISLHENSDKNETKLLLKEVWDVLGSKEGWQLVGMTHRLEGAWAKNYNPRINITIPNKDILEEYRINKNG